MSETTVTFDNGRVYTREGDRYVWRTSPDSIGDIIAERDMVWAFDKLAASQAALAAARREVETVNEEAERQAGVICNLNTDLATSRAALEDVRRVEAWIQAGNAPDLPEHSIAGLVNARYGAIVRWEDEETTVATGDSLEALGRALAQEAGDAMR